MQLKKLKIGNVITENNVFLAPLAGYTNFAFRSICKTLGAGLTFTEMVSCKGLKYNSEATKNLLYTAENENIKAVQIFGCDKNVMEWAAKSEYLEKFDIIDINMGCPVPKIYGNGEGSALLKDIGNAYEIIRAVKSSGKAVTVKFRIGLTENNYITETFAKMCEDAGADLITIHGRVRTAMYSGEVNFKEIEKAKKAVKIPVIANGGIFSVQDADEIIEKTGADGIMLARGAMYAPWLFSEILGKDSLSHKELIKDNITMLLKKYDEKFVSVTMRKQMACYLKGIKGCKKLRDEILHITDVNELLNIVEREF